MAYINKTEKDVFRLITSVGQRKNFESSWGIVPQTFGFRALMHYHWATETLRWARSITKFVALFLYRTQNLPSLIFISHIYKHDAIDIADPSNTQDAYHINFVINLAHCRVCGSVSGHRSAESDCEVLRFDSSWRPRIFFFVPRSWNIFLYFFTELQTCYLSYSINKTVGPLVIFSVFSTWFACWKNLHCNQCLLKGLCWPRNVLQWYFIIVIVHLFHSAGTHKEFKTDAKNNETFAAHGLK